MSFAELILRRPLWDKLSTELNLPLREGSAATALYDSVAELMHGQGARFPEEQQKQVEQTADRMKSMIADAGQRSSVLGALVSVLIPTSLGLEGEREGVRLAVVPDHLSPSAHKDSRLLLAAFHASPLDLDLQIVPEDWLFQKARQYTKAQDIQIGHPELDERAVITGRDEGAIKERLTRPEVLQPLLSLLQQEGKWLINDRGALITVTLKDSRAERALAALVQVAKAFR